MTVNGKRSTARAFDPLDLSQPQVDAMRQLGYVFLRHGQYQKAKALFAALHALRGDDPQIAASLGFAMLKLGDFNGVLNLLEQIYPRVEPPAAVVHALRAKALSGKARRTAAHQSMATFIHEQRKSRCS